ncbi:MAG: protocatechuate 3,4-dioxygenase subunit alpha [Cypionkella sp.]|nr:protocatechuate 3,4-dioxygenase subunit alpha [Cypionkella sp.]
MNNLGYLTETISQTAGPYVHIGLAPGAAGFKTYDRELGEAIAPEGVAGQRVRVEGLVLDGLGTPVKDVLIEVWQADSNGIYPHPEDARSADCAAGFRGWGRVISDFETGLFVFDTIKPGATPGRGKSMQAPHLSLWLVSRGINIGLNTRMYFPEDGDLHKSDPILNAVEQPIRRQTMIAVQTAPNTYRFDIRLQGEGETVFIDV